MNLKFNFENVTFEKNIGKKLIISLACLIIGVILISLMSLTNHTNVEIKSIEEKTELIALDISKDIENTTKSLEFINVMLSDDSMREFISPAQVTSLLNDLISSDPKIYAAFVMLDKSEFADIETLSNKMSFISNSDEVNEAMQVLGDTDEEEKDKDKDNKNDIERNIVSLSDNIVNGVNKLVYKSGGSTYETTLDRINNIEYKKNYLSVLLTKKAQMMKPYTNIYDGVSVETCTYTVPIIKNGLVEGIIGFDIDINELNKQVQEKNKDIKANYILTDKEGQVITASNNQYIGRNISEIYQGDSSFDVLEFFEENKTSGVIGRLKKKTLNVLNDDLYISVPIIVGENHAWNITVISTIDRIVTNSIGLILFVTVLNILAFGLLIFALWHGFSKMINKRLDKIFNKVEKELDKIKSTSSRILDDIENIEEIDIEEFDSEDDDIESDTQDSSSDEIVPEVQVSAAEEEKLNDLLNKVDFDKYEEDKTEELIVDPPIIEEPKIEEPKIEEPIIEEPIIEEPKIEEPKIEEPIIEEPKIEEPKIEEPIIEEPKIEEPKIEEPKIEEPKIEEPKINLEPIEDEAGNKLSAIDQLATQEISGASDELDDILSNKNGNIEDDSFLADAEARMQKAITENTDKSGNEPAIEEPKIEEPIIEEPKIEEPKIEEPKIEETIIEEPKIEEPVIEEPKIEEPKIEEPKIEEPKIEEPIIEEPKIEEPKIEEPKIEKPKKSEPKKEKTLVASDDMGLTGPSLNSDDAMGANRGKKLTNREMDSLLKELENNRKSENETLGINEEITSEFSNETTLDPNDIMDLVGKIKKE